MIEPSPLPFARLDLVDDPAPRAAALNMALDEVLLERISGAPLLRVYRWECPAVSFGYFEPVAPVMSRWPCHDLVRRWTGGGIVVHGEDLTFSLLVPRVLALATLPAAESYRLIHSAVASALAEAGMPAATLQDAAPAPGANASRACFENPVPHDLLLSGRKVAGGAQRRTRRGLLHQGSIQNAAGAGGVSLGRQTMRALSLTLPRAFSVSVEARVLHRAEIEAATALASAKYGSAEWLHRS